MRDPDTTTQVFAGSSAPLALGGRQGKQIRHGVGFADDDGGARTLAWWDEAVPIAGTPAERCVRRAAWCCRRSSRRGQRFHPDRPFGEGRHLCLPSLYRDMRTDAPQAITRSALTPDARKIDRTAFCPVRGAAIKVSNDPDDGPAHRRRARNDGHQHAVGSRPAWVLGAAGATRTFPVLAGIEVLMILTETGDASANVRAVRECASRWIGREVADRVPKAGDELNDALTA